MRGVRGRELAGVVMGTGAAFHHLLLGLVEVPHLVLEVDRRDAFLLEAHADDVLPRLIFVVGLVATEIAGLGFGLLAGLRGLPVTLKERRSDCELGGLAGLYFLIRDCLDILLFFFCGVPRVY